MGILYPIYVPRVRGALCGRTFKAAGTLVIIAEIITRVVSALGGVIYGGQRFVIHRVALGQVVPEELALSFERIGVITVLFAPAFKYGKARCAPLAKPLVVLALAGFGIEVGFLLDVGQYAAGDRFIISGPRGKELVYLLLVCGGSIEEYFISG